MILQGDMFWFTSLLPIRSSLHITLNLSSPDPRGWIGRSLFVIYEMKEVKENKWPNPVGGREK